MSTQKNVWQIIFDVLKKNGIDVYPPATHNGVCKAPYVVLKKGGTNKIYGYSSRRDYYLLLIYVPRSEYSKLSDYEAEIKSIMDRPPLYPMVMPTGDTENDFYDDNINGHLRIISYYNNVRDKHL